VSLRSRIRLPGGHTLEGSPHDWARWAFWVPLRQALDPRRPQQLRRAWPLWRAQYLAAGSQKEAMRAELTAIFGPQGIEDMVRDAYRIAFRVHLEEVLLGKLTPDTWPNFMRFAGRENLDAALDRGKGAIIAVPHAGNFMMMIASVSLAGYPYTQYAARGMAPPEVAQAHAEVFGVNRWREEARAARESNEDRLPANFITLETNARELYRRLEANEVIGLSPDGRIGKKFVPLTYLGRQALLNPGVARLARGTGAAIVPTLCSCPADDVNICTFAEPIYPEEHGRKRPWRELLEAYFVGAVEPWVREHPGEYGIWLAHCRERAAVDDHPLFTDYAPDERYLKYL